MTGGRATGDGLLTGGGAGVVGAAIGSRGGAATGVVAAGAGAVAAGVDGVSGCGELRLRENLGHTVNTRPAIRIAAAALPNIGSRLAKDARGRGLLACVALARGGGTAGTSAATGGGSGGCGGTAGTGAATGGGCGGCGGAATVDGAADGAIGNRAATIVAEVVASRGAGAGVRSAAIAAASSGVILIRTVSDVELTAGRGGLAAPAARRANTPSTTCATVGIASITCALAASASTATAPRNNESSAYTSTFTRQYPARCGVSRNAMRFE
jgi:hypothetical protein